MDLNGLNGIERYKLVGKTIYVQYPEITGLSEMFSICKTCGLRSKSSECGWNKDNPSCSVCVNGKKIEKALKEQTSGGSG